MVLVSFDGFWSVEDHIQGIVESSEFDLCAVEIINQNDDATLS